MKGSTKVIAVASARGRKRSAVKKVPMAAMCRSVRRKAILRTCDGIVRLPPVSATTGSRISACPAKRQSSTWTSGTLAPRSLAVASPSGTTAQKPRMKAMPSNGRSAVIARR